MREISIREVLNHLENGVTRVKDSAGYDPAIGSIQEKYELSVAEVKEMFQHPLLKNKKTKPPKSFKLIDDVTEAKEATSTAVPSYGARPAGSSPSRSQEEVSTPTAENTQETVSEEVAAEVEVNLTQEDLA